jgi:hypothetical protein
MMSGLLAWINITSEPLFDETNIYPLHVTMLRRHPQEIHSSFLEKVLSEDYPWHRNALKSPSSDGSAGSIAQSPTNNSSISYISAFSIAALHAFELS